MEQEKIGKFIAELRKEKKMTQDDLARALYTDRSIVSKWERGLYVPKYDIILKLSDLFDVSVNEIYYGERQNEENKNKVNQVTINIIKENKKKVKTILVVSLCIIAILITSFFIYYFLNTYSSISVYTVTGESENIGIYDGIIVISKEKSYIQLGNIELLNDVQIKNIKLYYKKKNKECVIFTNDGTPKLLINNFKHSEIFPHKDLKYIVNDLYLEIIFDNDKIEIINLKVQKDFTNNNVFTPNHSKITNGNLSDTTGDIPKYIKDNFIFVEQEEKYYLKEINEDVTVIQTYYINAKLYTVEEIYDDKTIYFEYFVPNDISYDMGDNEMSTYVIPDNKCTSEQCNLDIINYFIDEYIRKINFEN